MVSKARWAAVQDNVLSSIQHLTALRALRHLALDGNRLASAARLAALPRLTHLSLSHNALTTLAPLRACTRLQVRWRVVHVVVCANSFARVKRAGEQRVHGGVCALVHLRAPWQ